MNHKQYIVRSLMFILVGVFAAGCAGTQAELSSTVAPQTCPTAAILSCPTNVPSSCPTLPACPTISPAQFSSAENKWFAILSNVAAINIFFDHGDKCTVNAPSSMAKGMQYYQIKVNDQAHATYAVVFQTLDEGKTLEDLQAYPDTALDAPSWDHLFQENYVTPGSNSYATGVFPAGQIYISCFVSTADAPVRILDYGPIEVK